MKSEDKLALLLKVAEDVYPSPRRIMWLSFLRGVFFGLGTTLGASLLIGILTYLLSQLAQLPGFEGAIFLKPIEELLKQ